jgi:acyl-CoA thioesterase I
MKVRKYLLMLAFIGLAITALSVMANDAQADSHYWKGTAGASAGTPTNWKPTVTDWATSDLYWGAVANTNCAYNLTTSVSSWHILSNYTAVLTEGTNDVHVGSGGITHTGTGTLTGKAGYTIYCAGSFSSSKMTAAVTGLVMTGDGTTLSGDGNNVLLSVRFSANVTYHGLVGTDAIYNFYVDSGKTFTIADGEHLNIRNYNTRTFSNLGSIRGINGGYLSFTIYDADKSPTFGNISCPVKIYANTNVRTLTFPASTNLGRVTIASIGSNILTVDMAGHSINTQSINIGAYGKLLSSATGAKLNSGSNPYIFMVGMGDSITQGSAGTGRPSYTAQLIGINQYVDILNKGISGQTTADMAARFTSDVINNHPDYVVILAGTNDINAGWDVATIEAGLKGMYDAALANNINVIACTITPNNDLSAGAQAKMVDVNNWIRAQASDKIIIADTNIATRDPTNYQNILPAYNFDDLHMNAAGYAAIAACVNAVIPATPHNTQSITVSANGVYDARNITTYCSGVLDLSAGTYRPGTTATYLTNIGTTKLASNQYFYDLIVNSTATRTMLSNIVVQHRLIIDGTVNEGIYLKTVNGTSTTPFTGNGTWSGVINITSSGASYIIWTGASWTGTVQMSKAATIIYPGGQLVVTPPASTWYNVTMKGWTSPNGYKWYAGSTNPTANISFAASGLSSNGKYHVYLDSSVDKDKVASAGGVITYDHASWSGHFIRLEGYVIWAPTFTNSPSTSGTVGTMYNYTPNCNESVTYTMITNPSWSNLSGGIVSGTPNASGSQTFVLKATSVYGQLDAYMNWTVSVPIPISNVTIVFTTAPILTGNVGDKYHYDAGSNVEGMSGAFYALVTSDNTLLLDPTSGAIAGELQSFPSITMSLSISYNGTTEYQNWTITTQVLTYDLHVTIIFVVQTDNTVNFHYDFDGNISVISKFIWNFGDGNGSVDPNPEHTYALSGHYTVTIALFDDNGTVGYTTKDIAVGKAGESGTIAAVDDWWQANGMTLLVILFSIIAIVAVYDARSARRR